MSVLVLASLVYLPAALESGVGAIVANDFVAARPWSELPNAWRLGFEDLQRWFVRDGLIAVALPTLVVVGAFDARANSLRLLTPGLSIFGPLALLPLQRVAPPTRVWLFAWPLALGLAGIGMRVLLDRLKRPARFSWLVPVLAILMAAAMSGRVIASGQVLESREAGIFRDGPQVAALLAANLEPGDRVAVESHPRWVLSYYLEEAGVGTAALARQYAHADRVFAVVYHPRGQALDSVLDEAGVPRDRFVAADLFESFAETEVVLLRPEG